MIVWGLRSSLLRKRLSFPMAWLVGRLGRRWGGIWQRPMWAAWSLLAWFRRALLIFSCSAPVSRRFSLLPGRIVKLCLPLDYDLRKKSRSIRISCSNLSSSNSCSIKYSFRTKTLSSIIQIVSISKRWWKCGKLMGGGRMRSWGKKMRTMIR